MAESLDPPAEVTKICLLGGFRVLDESGQPVDLKSRKHRQLMAYLSAPVGKCHSREHLASLLWQDRQDEQARSSLRTALSGLRHSIGPDAFEIAQDMIGLRPDRVSSDFDLLRKAGPDTGFGPDPARPDAAEFLPGQEYDGEIWTAWLLARRSETRDLQIDRLERMSARAGKEERPDDALALMRNCLALEPLREKSHREIMNLYLAAGERAMALAQFRSCREILRHELQTDPSAETSELAARIALNTETTGGNTGTNSSFPDMQPPGQTERTEHTALRERSIAVLPLVNMSGDAEQNYFADGITEDIITDLSLVDGLAVTANTSSQTYRGGLTRPDRIADELGVRFLLEGSVRRAGNRVRVTARLVDAPDNRQIWAKRYDRQMDDIFDLQTELSASIAEALRLGFSSHSQGPSSHPVSRNAEAYQEYLRARTFSREMTRNSLELAQEGFRRAVTLDPDYARAWAGLSEAVTYLGFHYAAQEQPEEGLAAAEKALLLAPELPQGHAAKGLSLSWYRSYEEGLASINTALTLDPDLYEAHYNRAVMFSQMGSPELALDSWRRAYGQAPDDLATGMMLMSSLDAFGTGEETGEVGRHMAAVARKRLALNPHDERAAYVLADALILTGDEKNARRWAGIAAALASADSRTFHNMACLFCFLGETETAFDYLEKSLDLGPSVHKLQWIRHGDPDLEPLRNDPRFKALFEDQSD